MNNRFRVFQMVSLVAILSVALVIPEILRGLILIGVVQGIVVSGADPSVVSTWATPIGIGTLVLAIATIVAGFGLYRMKKWGYWGTFGLNVISLVLNVVLKVNLGFITGTAAVLIWLLSLRTMGYPQQWASTDKEKIGTG